MTPDIFTQRFTTAHDLLVSWRDAARCRSQSVGFSRPGRSASLLIGALLLTLLGALPAHAQSGKPVQIEDVRVGFDNRFQIGTWTPVRVQVRAGAGGFDGFVDLIANDDDGSPTRTRYPILVGGGEQGVVTGYSRGGSRSPDFRVRLVNKEEKVVDIANVETLRKGDAPSPLFPTDISILVLGKISNVADMARQAGMSVTAQGASREVYVARIEGSNSDQLPGRPQGYDGFDAVVLDTNDKEMLAALNTRGAALSQWVARGGHLVISVGSNWQAVKESLLASILPVKISSPVQVTDLRALESYAQATTQITPDNVAAQVVRLEGSDASGAKVLSTTASTPLIVRGAYGFGRVTVLSFDVDVPPFSTWKDASLFWIKTIDLTTGSGVGGASKTSGRLVQTGASGLSALLRSSLDQFSGVRLVPFGWVALLIFVYILLIGPFDYFFLKKVVKRMELTWVTFPLIVIGVSAGAAYAAYRIKGTELRVNQLEVVDIDEVARQTRGTTYLNVFSPSNRDYSISFKPTASGPMGTTDADLRMSWLGAADTGLRGMNGNARGLSFANDGYSYAPLGGAERIEGLRIPIWSTKALQGQWFGKSTGQAIESDLAQVGPDRLAGTVTNRLPVPLKGVIVAFGSQVYYNIPEIAPGATTRIELSVNRQLSGYLGELRKTYDLQDQLSAGVIINRANLLRAAMFSRSENAGLDPLSNGSIEDLDLSDQLRLDRPMLIAEVEAPASEVEIGPTTDKPKVSRTTMIRVILPLDRSGGR